MNSDQAVACFSMNLDIKDAMKSRASPYTIAASSQLGDTLAAYSFLSNSTSKRPITAVGDGRAAEAVEEQEAALMRRKSGGGGSE
jgi:hypothetical protein